jgi:hypothetical protein
MEQTNVASSSSRGSALHYLILMVLNLTKQDVVQYDDQGGAGLGGGKEDDRFHAKRTWSLKMGDEL